MSSFSPIPLSEEFPRTGNSPLVRLSFAAAAGQAYVIQRSHDQLRWMNVTTISAGVARMIEIGAARGGGQHFYRAVAAVSHAANLLGSEGVLDRTGRALASV